MKTNTSVTNILINVYLVLTACMVPLYLANGYIDAGERKSLLFISGAAVLAVVSTALSWKGLIADLSDAVTKVLHKKATHQEWLIVSLLLSAIFHTVSLGLSKYKKTALFGIVGWRMGFVPQLLFLLFSVLIILYYEITDVTWYILFSGELAVLILGIVNRLGIFPIPRTDIGMHYISMTGNIDWTLTYFSVLYPLNIGLLLQTKDDKQLRKKGLMALLTINAILTQLVLFMLGSGSSFVILALPILLIPILAMRGEDHKLFPYLLISTGCMAEAAWMIRMIAGGNKWNDVFSPGNPLTMFARNHGGALLATVTVIIHILMQKRKKVYEAKPKQLAGLQTIIETALLCLPILLLFFQVFIPGFFGDYFGNGRGYIWRISANAIRSFTLPRLMIGTGQDTMGIVIANIHDNAELASHYGDAMLMNSHSLLLNKLFETGLLGVGAFIAILACALYCLKACLKSTNAPYVVAIANAVLCYYLLETIMFEQVIATPLFYVMIGFAGVLAREQHDDASVRDE